jgi:DNA-binding transcriptional ArsR family regulator
MPTCSTEAVDPSGQGGLCPEHRPDTDADESGDSTVSGENGKERGEKNGSPGSNPTPEAEETGAQNGKTPAVDGWGEVDFSNTTSDTYPPALLNTEQWMGRKEKLPFAPWGDRNAALECSHTTCPEHDDETAEAVVSDCPECQAHRDGTTTAECDHDARFKWGHTEHYVDGETVDMAEDDPRLDGRVFIQQDSDRFVFVDGDDVRCPETGAVHPEFIALLDRLGFTYADISTSGAGVHAYYTGEIPVDGQGQAVFDIDTEPWGENDDAPTVEIYANKHVCVATGDHVRGTPEDVVEWDHAELELILDENDARKETVSHDTDRERDDLADYEPTATGTDETTEEMRDVLKAVDRLTPSDVRLNTSKTGADSTGWTTWDPSYRTSASGESLHYNGEGAFHDHKEGEAFGVLSLLAAEERIITDPWDDLSGSEWWDAVETAREQGARIPEYVGKKSEDAEPVAVLPPAVKDLSTATSGWDWRHTATEGERDLSISDARERTVAAISDAYETGDRVLVEALPTMGKSYGAIKAAAETGEQVTVLTGRGQKEQYAQFKDWAAEFGLSYYQLPSFTRDCPTAAGDHGEEWREKVLGWYRRGATPQVIHAYAEDLLGRPLPCQCDDEGNHTDCPYAAKWDFDADEYDVLIGHYTHAYKENVTSGRVAVLDEFPAGAYESTLSGTALQGAVSYWLDCTDAVPFDDYTDLVENRDDETRRADGLAHLLDDELESDEKHVLDDHAAHADAPLAVFTLLAGEDLGNGFEKAGFEDDRTGVFNRETGEVSVLQPPSFDYASGVVALDGTPTKRMWEESLGTRLNHREILQGDERTEYVRDALNLNIIRTTEYVKPYNSADHVNTEQDAALLGRVAEQHDEKPGVITTTTAEEEYDAEGVLDLVDDTKHYGNVLGSNEFKEKRLGAVIGSNHYGDEYLQKWGAYAGETVERNTEKGAGLSYNGFGDDVLTHMREHETLQAAMRFGRDGNGAVVYVHTDTLPEWVPLAGEGRVVTTWSDGMKAVLGALEELERATTAEITERVDLSRQQVFDHLETLRERDVLHREQDDEDGRRVLWQDDGIHRVNDHGEVDLDPVGFDELDETEVRQLARNSIYTWEFTNRPECSDGQGEQRGETEATTTTEATAGGDRPPTGAD